MLNTLSKFNVTVSFCFIKTDREINLNNLTDTHNFIFFFMFIHIIQQYSNGRQKN